MTDDSLPTSSVTAPERDPLNEPSAPAATAPDGGAPDADEEGPSAEFAAALQSFNREAPRAEPAREVTPGARVHGRIVSIGDEHLVVDFGGRSEGVAETRAFRNEDGSLRVEVGQEIDLYVTEAGDQIVLAPSLKADAKAGLDRLRAAQSAGIPVSGRVTALTSGGLTVDLGGARGFCPLSQIESGYCAEPSSYVGRTLEFVVTGVEEARGGAVLSRKQLLKRAEEEGAKELLATLQAGDERDGTVARLEPFGAFVNLGGVDGLVHVSEIRHERLGHPKEALKVGEKVRVRVLKIDSGKDGKRRIALSIKAVSPDPWIGVADRFTRGARVRGTVARLAEFGAFVNLEPGVDGLVHVSEAAPHRVEHVRDAVKVGQEVEAVVLAVDPEKKRISLSIREASAGAAPAARKPAVGDVLEGKVSGVKPFGVFVDLPDYGPRVRGMVPRDEAGNGNLENSFPVGMAVTVEVIPGKDDRVRLKLAGAFELPESARVAAPHPSEGGARRSEGGARRPEGGARRPEGGARRSEGGGRRPEGGARRPDAGARRSEVMPRRPEAPAEDAPLTTMAIALRKAMEKAKKA